MAGSNNQHTYDVCTTSEYFESNLPVQQCLQDIIILAPSMGFSVATHLFRVCHSALCVLVKCVCLRIATMLYSK